MGLPAVKESTKEATIVPAFVGVAMGGSMVALSAPLFIIIGAFLPSIIFALIFFVLPTVDREHRYHEKITKGRFKGKYLLDDWEVEDLENKSLKEPVEVLLSNINNKTYIDSSSLGSTLAQATIDRLELELDPMCRCPESAYIVHRVSTHDIVAKQVCDERLALREKQSKKKAKKYVDKDEYDFRMVESAEIWTYRYGKKDWY